MVKLNRGGNFPPLLVGLFPPDYIYSTMQQCVVDFLLLSSVSRTFGNIQNLYKKFQLTFRQRILYFSRLLPFKRAQIF